MSDGQQEWFVLASPKGDRRVATDEPANYPGWSRLTPAILRRDVAEAISADFSLTKEQDIMSRMQELIAEYNRLSPDKPVKRFSSVAAGEKRLAAIKGESAPAARPKAASASKRGRNSSYTHVELLKTEQEGRRFNEGSARGQVFAYIKQFRRVTLATLKEKFGANVGGHVQKLATLEWVKTVNEA